MAEISSIIESAAEEGGDSLEIREVGLDYLGRIYAMNQTIFDEKRIINTFDRENLIILYALKNSEPAGFKIGYHLRDGVYYSAKGGVMPRFRRSGVARALLYRLMDLARDRGYREFLYDTFPNKHPGMTVLGLTEEFTVVRAGYNAQYDDYRLRLSKRL